MKKRVVLSVLFLMGLVIASLLIPVLNLDATYMDPNLMGVPQPPSFTHIFGTDELGRDIFIRCIFGARVSLIVSVVSMGIALLIGVFVGIISGYLGGMVDEVLMRMIDMLMALPNLFLILMIQVVLEPHIINVMIVIGITSWMGVARLVRAEMLSIKERVFVVSLRARGLSAYRILFKHLLPHTLNPVIVAAMLGMGGAILVESVLSFLGLGVQPPHASWGNMLESSLGYLRIAPWMALIPGILITCTVLSLNFIGDGIWLLIDPKTKDAHAQR